MNTILGIDADTKQIAYCRLDPDGKKYKATVGIIMRRDPKTKHFLPKYAEQLRGVLYPILEKNGIIFLEDVYRGPNIRTFGHLSQVQGEIRYEVEAVHGSNNLTLVAPTTWQSYTRDQFKVYRNKVPNTKDCAMTCAARILGYMTETTHEADATCLAYYGWKHADSKTK